MARSLIFVDVIDTFPEQKARKTICINKYHVKIKFVIVLYMGYTYALKSTFIKYFTKMHTILVNTVR